MPSAGRLTWDTAISTPRRLTATRKASGERYATAAPVAAVEQCLGRLGLDHVDLYLIHWPEGGRTWAWPGMERAREMDAARSVGASNFSAAELKQVIAAGTVPTAVNQVEFNPPHYRRGLLDACRKQDVAVEAYSRLGDDHLAREPVAVLSSLAISLPRPEVAPVTRAVTGSALADCVDMVHSPIA